VNFESIELTRKGGLAILKFNRPDSYNALNERMGLELVEAIIDVQNDPAVRCLLLTGNGAAFHAGGDVKSFLSAGEGVSGFIDRLVISFHAFISHLVRMAKPTVAAVNGTAAGAGFSIAMACDLVLARQDALFTAAYSRIGASPDGAMTYFLVRQVGVRRAMELYLTNRVLTAQEAHDWGLVTRVLPVEGFLAEAMALAGNLAQGPTAAYGRAKDLFYHSTNHELETQMELEARGIVASSRTADFREGTRAFTEKRAAQYLGR
jgi:2-(1,2-epoxy-1,2-dihydrophenyl)acetyl-CoA isomerase